MVFGSENTILDMKYILQEKSKESAVHMTGRDTWLLIWAFRRSVISIHSSLCTVSYGLAQSSSRIGADRFS